MAAEIMGHRPAPGPRAGCFNEAAANGRGNPPWTCFSAGRAPPASMRPRRMAAEIVLVPPALRAAGGFNEAAANGRGNPTNG